jgi:hypothetical protein
MQDHREEEKATTWSEMGNNPWKAKGRVGIRIQGQRRRKENARMEGKPPSPRKEPGAEVTKKKKSSAIESKRDGLRPKAPPEAVSDPGGEDGKPKPQTWHGR